jgi:streptogramin lyase
MTLDENGDLWAAGYCNNAVFHYSAQNNQWTQVSGSGGNWVLGVMADGDGSVWGAGVQPCRLVRVDVASKTFVNNNIALPGCSEPWGVSIDFEGNVWVVDKANKAFKVDSDTYQVLSVVEGPRRSLHLL